MSGWDVIDVNSTDAGGWGTVEVKGESLDGYNIKSIKKEKVMDTNPNLYLQRAEAELREGRYDEAVEEARIAVKYADSSNRREVQNEFDRIKRAVDEYKESINPDSYINRAENMLSNGKYNEAIKEASLALKYSNNNSKYIDLYNSIKKRAEARLALINNIESNINKYKSQAVQHIKNKEFNEAITAIDKAMSLSTKQSVTNELLELKMKAKEKKNEMIADGLISKAYGELLKEEYHMAIRYADDAVKCSGCTRIVEKRAKLLRDISNKKAEKRAQALVTTVENYIDEGKYYEALNELENLPKITQGNECHNRFAESEKKLEAEIIKVPDEEKEKIADQYFDKGRYGDAKEWYEYAGMSSSYFKLGKMLIYKKMNVQEGIEFLEKALDMKNPQAAIELMRLCLERVHVKKSLNSIREYYRKLKAIDKSGAKAVLRMLKKEFNLSLYKRLRIKGQFKAAMCAGTGTFIAILIGISMMFATGQWKGIVLGSSIKIEKDKIGVNESVKCDADIKVLPFFAKYPEKKVAVDDDFIASYDNGRITGLSQGNSEIILYADGKELRRVPFEVCSLGIESFKISYKNDLINVGDSIEPQIEISYLNDIEIKDVEISYTSSNEDVVRVVNNKKLVAIEEGHAEVIVRVNDVEKKLIFDITDSDKKQDVFSEVTYTNYKDTMFGYSIDIPSIFTSVRQVDGGKSYHYDSEDGKVFLKFGGAYNTGNVSARSRYDNMMSNVGIRNVEYNVFNGSSYVISYNKDGYSYYYHEVVGTKSINGFIIGCRIEELESIRPIIERVFMSFKAPDVNKANSTSASQSNSNSKIKEMRYNDGSYMFRDSDTVLLSDDDVKNLSKETLAFLRNEMYARKGYIFKEEPYKSYFNSKSWYRGTRNEIDDSIFNDCERLNMELIRKYERA